MADSQRRRQAVGARRGGWAQLNALAIAAVVVAGGVLFVAVIGGVARDGGSGGGANLPPIGNTAQPTGTGQASGTPTQPIETPQPTEDDPETVSCGDILAPVDKQHRLPSDCAPGDLVELPANLSHGGPQRMRAEAATAFAELAAAAGRDGAGLRAVSAYRSYEAQVVAYEENRAIYGDDVDRFSARPGHSEHQMGTTVDVSTASAGYGLETFEGTAEAAWVQANSWRHGFIVSYPDGKEGVTGYAYEPWHIRYVGTDVARDVHRSGKTLHEYLLDSR